jgi:hypothetical protein
VPALPPIDVRVVVVTALSVVALSACAKKEPDPYEFLDKHATFFNCQTGVISTITEGGRTLEVKGHKFPFLISERVPPADPDRWRPGDNIYMCEFQAVGAPSWRFNNARSGARMYIGENNGEQ